MKRILLLAAILSITVSFGSTQESHDMSAMPANSMEDHHMDMGPHMKMTELRDPKPGDEQRAAQVVESARQAAAKYQDYHAALADGYEISYRIFLRRCTTSPRSLTPSRLPWLSIPNTQLRFSTKSTVTITNLSV